MNEGKDEGFLRVAEGRPRVPGRGTVVFVVLRDRATLPCHVAPGDHLFVNMASSVLHIERVTSAPCRCGLEVFTSIQEVLGAMETGAIRPFRLGS
jgi:hypothetical protein